MLHLQPPQLNTQNQLVPLFSHTVGVTLAPSSLPLPPTCFIGSHPTVFLEHSLHLLHHLSPGILCLPEMLPTSLLLEDSSKAQIWSHHFPSETCQWLPSAYRVRTDPSASSPCLPATPTSHPACTRPAYPTLDQMSIFFQSPMCPSFLLCCYRCPFSQECVSC